MRDTASGIDGDDLAGLDLSDATEDRIRRRYITEAKEAGDRSRIDFKLETGGHQSLQLRGKPKPLRIRGEHQRLDAEPVADQVQRAFGTIPQREGEHPVHVGERAIDAPMRERLKNDFSIRRALEGEAR